MYQYNRSRCILIVMTVPTAVIVTLRNNDVLIDRIYTSSISLERDSFEYFVQFVVSMLFHSLNLYICSY